MPRERARMLQSSGAMRVVPKALAVSTSRPRFATSLGRFHRDGRAVNLKSAPLLCCGLAGVRHEKVSQATPADVFTVI